MSTTACTVSKCALQFERVVQRDALSLHPADGDSSQIAVSSPTQLSDATERRAYVS